MGVFPGLPQLEYEIRNDDQKQGTNEESPRKITYKEDSSGKENVCVVDKLDCHSSSTRFAMTESAE